MDQSEIIRLLKNYREGNLSDSEKDILDAWYLTEASKNHPELDESKLNRSYAYLKSQLPIKGASRKKTLWQQLGVAATIAVLISCGLLYVLNMGTSLQVAAHQSVKAITPGGRQGILTLSNGKQLLLTGKRLKDTVVKEASDNLVTINLNTDGALTYKVSKDEEDQINEAVLYNTLSTPVGGQYSILLSDGTKVYLNSVSSIRYPTRFSRDQRVVEVEGEAYFEVSKDSKRPFIVKSVDHEIQVLGTHFNISAYTDDARIKTTLLEGSVAVTYNNKTVTLKPGQQSTVEKKERAIPEVRYVDPELAVAWKNGRFKFDNTDIKLIMRQLERWYDIEVAYGDQIPDLKFTGGTFMSENLSEVLKILELNNIKFKVEGKTLIVNP